MNKILKKIAVVFSSITLLTCGSIASVAASNPGEDSKPQLGKLCTITEHSSKKLIDQGIMKKDTTTVIHQMYDNTLKDIPHKYISVIREFTYYQENNQDIFSKICIYSNFRYTKGMKLAECLSSTYANLSNKNKYSVEIRTDHTNARTDLGCSTTKLKFKYDGTTIDKVKLEITCDPEGNVDYKII